ncbi:MAG: dihydrofolate reductase family protein [Solirubrobacteraceae bacterium]
MSRARQPHAEADGGGSLQLEQLLPTGPPATVPEVIEQLGLWERQAVPPERPRALLNMIATVDGRATIGGRSGAISSPADRALFHGLRSAVDAVLVGAGTVRTERYGRMIRDESVRRLRVERGLAEEPLACIVSGRLALPEDLPLLREPDARVAILTASTASLPAPSAQVEYVRTEGARLDLPAALREVARRFALQTMLCEGGPHLARELLAEGLIDEIYLSVSPLLAGGEPAGGEALRILAGAELEPPGALELLGVLGSGSSLFLRYGVSARERVSRETIESSSLAR